MRVVLADDEALLREGFARLLEEAGFEVSGTGQDAPDCCASSKPGGRT
jgi:DNA-binding NarL/FixJ family response regulator